MIEVGRICELCVLRFLFCVLWAQHDRSISKSFFFFFFFILRKGAVSHWIGCCLRRKRGSCTNGSGTNEVNQYKELSSTELGAAYVKKEEVVNKSRGTKEAHEYNDIGYLIEGAHKLFFNGAFG